MDTVISAHLQALLPSPSAQPDATNEAAIKIEGAHINGPSVCVACPLHLLHSVSTGHVARNSTLVCSLLTSYHAEKFGELFGGHAASQSPLMAVCAPKHTGNGSLGWKLAPIGKDGTISHYYLIGRMWSN